MCSLCTHNPNYSPLCPTIAALVVAVVAVVAVAVAVAWCLLCGVLCFGCGADASFLSTQVSVLMRIGVQEKTWTGASAPASSAGLTSRRKTLHLFPPGACSRRPPRRIQRRGKRLTVTGLTPESGEGSDLIRRFGVGSPGSGLKWVGYLGYVFLVSRALLTGMIPSSEKISSIMPTPST